MENNYLLESEDSLSLEKQIKELINKLSFNEAIVSQYDLEDDLIDNVLEDLDTYGFLSSRKIIIVKNISKLNVDDNKDNINHLFKYLDNYNSDNLLFITDKKLDDRKKITKELKKKMKYLKINLNASDFLKKELSDYKLEPGVIPLMIEYSLNDITKLYNDCWKLKEYRYDSKFITKDDVSELCIKKIGDTTALTFEFVKFLAMKNKKKALETYNELIETGVDSISIIGLIASQIRIIYQVKILSKKSLSDKDIATKLSENSSYRITKTRELIDYYTDDELLKMMQKLSDIDLKSKTESVDTNFLIQLLIINL